MLLVFALSFMDLNAQKFPQLDKSPVDIVYLPLRGGDKTIKVVYSRPQKKDRVIFGELVPYGKMWRAGANEATEITFFKDVDFGSHRINKGTYSLYVIPEEDKWTIVLNSKLNTWGSYSYDKKLDVARVEAPTKESDEVIEAFGISFDGKNMLMGWDKTYVQIPVTSK